jgi:hypothetical protein
MEEYSTDSNQQNKTICSIHAGKLFKLFKSFYLPIKERKESVAMKVKISIVASVIALIFTIIATISFLLFYITVKALVESLAANQGWAGPENYSQSAGIGMICLLIAIIAGSVAIATRVRPS